MKDTRLPPAVHDLQAAMGEQVRELIELDNVSDEIPESVYRRIKIRSVFALLEICSRLLMCATKPSILRQIAETNPTFDGDDSGAWLAEFVEILAMSETTFEVRENGSVAIKPLQIKFGSQLLLAIQAVYRATGVTYDREKDKGFLAVKSAIHIRNRVTHPKRLSDLSVTDEEIRTVEYALHWVTDHILSTTPSSPDN